MILSCLSAPWHSWELVQCSTLCTIFSCFQGDVLCDIDNCINPWFTESAGKETAPFPTVGFLIAQWSVIYRHLHWSPLCAGRKITAPRMFFVAQKDSWALWCSCLSLLCFRNVCTVRRLRDGSVTSWVFCVTGWEPERGLPLCRDVHGWKHSSAHMCSSHWTKNLLLGVLSA